MFLESMAIYHRCPHTHHRCHSRTSTKQDDNGGNIFRNHEATRKQHAHDGGATGGHSAEIEHYHLCALCCSQLTHHDLHNPRENRLQNGARYNPSDFTDWRAICDGLETLAYCKVTVQTKLMKPYLRTCSVTVEKEIFAVCAGWRCLFVDVLIVLPPSQLKSLQVSQERAQHVPHLQCSYCNSFRA